MDQSSFMKLRYMNFWWNPIDSSKLGPGMGYYWKNESNILENSSRFRQRTKKLTYIERTWTFQRELLVDIWVKKTLFLSQNPIQKVLDNFLITQSTFDKNMIFVISATSSIERDIKEPNRRQKVFFDPWGYLRHKNLGANAR